MQYEVLDDAHHFSASSTSLSGYAHPARFVFADDASGRDSQPKAQAIGTCSESDDRRVANEEGSSLRLP